MITRSNSAANSATSFGNVFKMKGTVEAQYNFRNALRAVINDPIDEFKAAKPRNFPEKEVVKLPNGKISWANKDNPTEVLWATATDKHSLPENKQCQNTAWSLLAKKAKIINASDALKQLQKDPNKFFNKFYGIE